MLATRWTSGPRRRRNHGGGPFKIDEKVAKHLVEHEGLETLGDFCGFFSHENEVETRPLTKISDLQRRGLQTSHASAKCGIHAAPCVTPANSDGAKEPMRPTWTVCAGGPSCACERALVEPAQRALWRLHGCACAEGPA